MRKKECVAMLLAGGQGSRLGCLTKKIAKPAVSFGGKYRIIDTVGVLTQYKPLLLNSYIEKGDAWDLDNPFGGVHILPPYMSEDGGSWYKGTANSVYQNLDFISLFDPDYVLIISGDHIYKMDYSAMLSCHKKNNADTTISVLEVPWEDASRFGILSVDEDYQITEFSEKPENPKSNLASMGIYIFNWSVLKEALLEDEANDKSDNDFGKNVIPMLLEQGKNLFAYQFNGYWKDVGTIESYYSANMELLRDQPELDIFSSDFKIYSNEEVLPPHYLGSKAIVENSLISNGCTVFGKVINSILGPGVYIGEGARVEDSIILPNATIHTESWLRKTILGENSIVKDYCSIGIKIGGKPIQSGITVIEDNVTIAEDSLIEEGKNIFSQALSANRRLKKEGGEKGEQSYRYHLQQLSS